jgi:hypothetical protein
VRKAILMMLLTAAGASAAATWVEVASDETQAATFYVDPTSVRRSGDVAQMWSLYDFKTVTGTAGMEHLSAKGQREYDCKGERVRLITLVLYSGNMGEGAEVHDISDPLSRWEPVPRNSIGEALWKAACRKL